LKILVRNLSRDVTEAELLALFTAHGRVQSCTVVMDQVTGGSKGFGFANMPVPHEAKAAMQALNGLSVKGTKMRVKKADPVPKQAEVAADETSSAASDASAVDDAAQAVAEAAARAKIKKDGSPLGMKKPRTFKKPSKH
jgi:RNA recognition motif-containing protein